MNHNSSKTKPHRAKAFAGSITGLTLASLLTIGGGLWLTAGDAHAQKATSVIPATQHCAAYSTDKTMFFLSNVSVVGMNCDIRSSLDRSGLTVHVPIKSFDSDSSGRDEHVAEILRVNESPDLIFRAPGITAAKIRSALKKGSMDLEGTLQVGKKKYPITTKATFVNGSAASGVIETTFTHFDIEPPNVGPGGMIADLEDKIFLHYNIQLSKLEGY